MTMQTNNNHNNNDYGLTPMVLLGRCADLQVNVHQAMVLLAMVELDQRKVVATRQAICGVLKWKVMRLQRHLEAMRWKRDVALIRTNGVLVPEGKGQPADIFELTAMGRKKLRGMLTGVIKPRENGGGRPPGVNVPAAPQSVVRVEPYRKKEHSTANIERPTSNVI